MQYARFRESIHSEKHKTIRRILIDKRKELGLSQQQLADKLGVIYSLVGKIETGDRRLDFVEMSAYCKTLEIDPCDMLKLIQNIE